MSCEEDLARAQTTLTDLIGTAKLAEGDITQLYK